MSTHYHELDDFGDDVFHGGGDSVDRFFVVPRRAIQCMLQRDRMRYCLSESIEYRPVGLEVDAMHGDEQFLQANAVNGLAR